MARDAGLAGHTYGWLGGRTRATDPLAGIVLMGARLYDPSTGRFLSVDPVPGGNANPYDYCTAGPINCFDLDGRVCWRLLTAVVVLTWWIEPRLATSSVPRRLGPRLGDCHT